MSILFIHYYRMSSIIRTPVGIVKAWQEGGISLYCSVIYLIAYTYNPTNSIHRFFFSYRPQSKNRGHSLRLQACTFPHQGKIISLSLYYVYVFAFHHIMLFHVFFICFWLSYRL